MTFDTPVVLGDQKRKDREVIAQLMACYFVKDVLFFVLERRLGSLRE